MKEKFAWNPSQGEIRKGALKYVEAIFKELEKTEGRELFAAAKEIVFIGYAAGVIAGKLSDIGIEGFTLLLNGIRISLDSEDRKEMIQFAVWDKEGDLHTSEEVEIQKK